MNELERERTSDAAPPDRLAWLVLAPSIWAIHFLACYLSVAIWCEKRGNNSGLGPISTLVMAYTLVAVVGIASVGWHSFRKHRFGDGELPHDAGTEADRRRFVGFAALLLALLSFVATLFTALAFVFVGNCD